MQLLFFTNNIRTAIVITKVSLRGDKSDSDLGSKVTPKRFLV